jgi:hypothetical protein
MAIKQELIIEIAKDGSLKIKTEGFKGSDCEAELKPIESALGKVKDRKRTADYYAQVKQNRKNTNTAK